MTRLDRATTCRLMRSLGLLLLTPLLASADDQEAATFKEAFTKARPTLAVRYRLESVDDDAFDKDALASTLRTALAYKSLPYKGLGLFLEAENVTVVGDGDDFNNAGAGSAGNGVTDRPVVADVALTEVNQAYIEYSRDGFSARVGRQEINLADQRYVGAVGWRQNHQSFDAVTLTLDRLPRTVLRYSFLDRAQRIFGDSKPMASHLLTVEIDGDAAGKFRLYGYLLDYDLAADAGLSTATYGGEWTGKVDLGSGPKLSWEIELAQQNDHGDNPAEVDAPYAHLRAGLGWPKMHVAAGWELLDGDPADGRFTTPLATLHKFNGWADKFLSTPFIGLEDLYLEVGAKAGAWTCLVRYHDFTPAADGADYGSEIDLQVVWKSPWQQTFAAKAALYDADALSSDTSKLMVWTAYTF